MDLKLNKAEWEGVSAEDRKKIEQIIATHFKDTKIVPDTNTHVAKELLAKRKLQTFNFDKPTCTAGCGLAEAAAAAACSLLPGLAVPICVAAVHAAGDWCRSQC